MYYEGKMCEVSLAFAAREKKKKLTCALTVYKSATTIAAVSYTWQVFIWRSKKGEIEKKKVQLDLSHTEVDNQTALQHADIPIEVQTVPVPASQGRGLVPQLNVPPHSTTLARFGQSVL